MMRTAIVTVFVLFLGTHVLLAQGVIGTSKQACKRNKAAAHLPVIESGVFYKPNRQELESKLKGIDTTQFCDCVFQGFEQSFGSERMSNMMQFTGSGTPDTTEENSTKEKVYFACFGRQIGQPTLSPPSQEEIKMTFEAMQAAKKYRK